MKKAAPATKSTTFNEQQTTFLKQYSRIIKSFVMDFLFASIIWFAFCLHAFDPTLEKIDREYMWCVFWWPIIYFESADIF